MIDVVMVAAEVDAAPPGSEAAAEPEKPEAAVETIPSEQSSFSGFILAQGKFHERLLYRRLLEALHLAAHEREEITPAAAIFAIINLGADVAIASGALWASARC